MASKFSVVIFIFHRTISNVESNTLPLGEAVEHVLSILPDLIPNLKKFAPGDVKYVTRFIYIFLRFSFPLREATKMVDRRREMLLTPVAALANILDQRFRGHRLGNVERTSALRSIPSLVDQWGNVAVNNPEWNDLLEFIGERRIYKESQSIACHPFHFWATLYADTSVAFMPPFAWPHSPHEGANLFIVDK